GRLCAGALEMPRGSAEVVRDSCAEWRADGPHWVAVRETAGAGFREFRRQIRITAQADANLRLGMTADLTDRHSGSSEMGATLTFWLEVPRFTILEADAKLRGIPFEGCARTV